MEPKIGLLLLFFLAALIFNISGTDCPDGWRSYESSCYYISTDNLNWIQAFNRCIALESYLVEIESSEEKVFLFTEIKSSMLDYYFIGLSDREIDGIWKWMTSGKVIEYTNWRPHEPRTTNNRNCGVIWTDQGGWGTISCSRTFRYICEKPFEDKPIVRPEMSRVMLGNIEGILSPYLQFRCNPVSKETNLYIIKCEGRHKVDLIKDVKQQGLYEDIFTGVCCLPEKTRNIPIEDADYLDVYHISASNNGYNFGEPYSVFVFDSNCHDILINDKNTYASLKFGFCFVDGLCIDDGQQMASDNCLACNASTDKFRWSHFDGCENEADKDNIVIYVAVAISVTALILILITVLIVWKWRLQKKPNIEPVTPDTRTEVRQEPTNTARSPSSTVLWTVDMRSNEIIPFKSSKCEEFLPFDTKSFQGGELKHVMHSATAIVPPFLESKDVENFHRNETRRLKGKEAKTNPATVIRVTPLSDFDK